MILLLFIIVLGFCSGSEITITRATQSSDYSTKYTADKAVDNDLTTRSVTKDETNAWLRVYFSSSVVEKVVIEKGWSIGTGKSCIYQVSVYAGEVKKPCGTYTGKAKHKFYTNEVVQCGGSIGDSVMLEMPGCGKGVNVYEIKVYSQSKLEL